MLWALKDNLGYYFSGIKTYPGLPEKYSNVTYCIKPNKIVTYYSKRTANKENLRIQKVHNHLNFKIVFYPLEILKRYKKKFWMMYQSLNRIGNGNERRS